MVWCDGDRYGTVACMGEPLHWDKVGDEQLLAAHDATPLADNGASGPPVAVGNLG